MKAKTKFIKMFSKLPEKARRQLVFDSYGQNPMSLGVMAIEIKNDTKLGELGLITLGYEDDIKEVESAP